MSDPESTFEVEVPLVEFELLLEPKLNAGAEADNFGLGSEVEVEGSNEKLGFEVVIVLAALVGGLKAKLGVEEGAAIGAGDAEEVEVEFEVEAVVDEPKLKVGVEGFAAAGVVPAPKPVKPAKGEGVALEEERREKRTKEENKRALLSDRAILFKDSKHDFLQGD